jgi:nucleotide-binding universal stress UspA family protein
VTLKRILYASDFSPTSRPAFVLAQEIAKAVRAELILFHAYRSEELIVGSVDYLPPRAVDEIMNAEATHARRQLERLARVAGRARVRVSTFVAQGPPAAAIVSVARTKRVNLLVLGTHGRTGVQRFLIGSVAERVVRTAPCPVLVAGPP